MTLADRVRAIPRNFRAATVVRVLVAFLMIAMIAAPVLMFMDIMAEGLRVMLLHARTGEEPPPWIADSTDIVANLALIWLALAFGILQVLDIMLPPRKVEPDA